MLAIAEFSTSLVGVRRSHPEIGVAKFPQLSAAVQ